MKTLVAEHLIFPHQQFARKQGKTLYSFTNAKIHSPWEEGEKTHARQYQSQMRNMDKFTRAQRM